MSVDRDQDPPAQRILVVIPDANVLVHGRHVGDIPWHEIGRDQIEVLTVGPVIRELDVLKNKPGRTGRIARDLSSRLRGIMEAPDRTVVVRHADPRVTQRIWLGPGSDAPVRSGLRLDHVDQSIINLGLKLLDQGLDVLLLTDDTICGATADEFGLPKLFLPEGWRRAAEADERDKEIGKLNAELVRFRAAEPRVALAFRNGDDQPIEELHATATRWPPLEPHQVDDLMAMVADRCPAASSFERPQKATDVSRRQIDAAVRRAASFNVSSRVVHEPATDEEIERYRSTDHPNWLVTVRNELATVHRRLQAAETWPVAVLLVGNEGTRPAEQTLLRIDATGELAIRDLDDEDREQDAAEQGIGHPLAELALSLPPSPPRGRERERRVPTALEMFGRLNQNQVTASFMDHAALMRPLPMPEARDPNSFYWRLGRKGFNRTAELECVSWRHQEEPVRFALRLATEEMGAVGGAIEATVSAANLSAPVGLRLPVRLTIEPGPTYDRARQLVDELAHKAAASGRL